MNVAVGWVKHAIKAYSGTVFISRNLKRGLKSTSVSLDKEKLQYLLQGFRDILPEEEAHRSNLCERGTGKYVHSFGQAGSIDEELGAEFGEGNEFDDSQIQVQGAIPKFVIW